MLSQARVAPASRQGLDIAKAGEPTRGTATGDVGSAGSWLLFNGIDDLGNQGLYALQGDGDPQLVSELNFNIGVYFREAVLETGVLPGRLV